MRRKKRKSEQPGPVPSGTTAAKRMPARGRCLLPGNTRAELRAEFRLWGAIASLRARDGNVRFTVTDHASRFLLLCEALESTREELAFTAFERLFAERGLPLAIRSDNGVPFASSNALFNLSKLSVWWLRLGIAIEASSRPIRSRMAAMSACTSPSRRKPPVRRA
jgi:transposase InsO family protein